MTCEKRLEQVSQVFDEMSPQNISKLLRNSSPFDETPSRSLMPKTTASKKKHRRNRSQQKNKRNQSQKAEKRKSRNNSLLLMNWRTLLRNEVELSSKRFLAEGSTKGVSAQDLRSKFQPIYQKCFITLLLTSGSPFKGVMECSHG